MAMVTARPIAVIPARPQSVWGWPAVVNFVLGGLGCGWYVVAVVAAGGDRSPGVEVASWVAPALVLAGFTAVAGEAGRPLRGPRVLARVRSSWMSRELLIGFAFILLVVADLAFPLRLHRAQAVAAAILLALAQGFVVRRARGIPAWDVPIMSALFLLSALVSGAGVCLLVETGAGRRPGTAAVRVLLALILAAYAAWLRYLGWTPDAVFVDAVAPLKGRPARLLIDGAGHALPFLLGVVALAVPGVAGPALAAAGALLVAGQVCAKERLILAAGHLRPITLSIALPRSHRA